MLNYRSIVNKIIQIATGEDMNYHLCNNCGGEYEYRNGRWVCRACGAYKPEEISNEEITLLYTAYQKLRLAEFEEAEKEFDDIIYKYPKNPNAYWGRLMSKYGIKYEQDFDGRMIPTCYATSIESVISASDYKKALEYADRETGEYYTRQAEYIERVRKEWVEKASREKPYDIFICYKDSDLANGIDRTQDSIAAQDLYIHLTNKGYRVFYSHESLRDKIGEKYEPYIFNALSTAKVMLVYGSKPEYITSTWLKNEWTRYEKRIRSGEKNPDSLLVACEGFSPAELPNALASRQCLNASEKSFYSALDEKIESILHPKNKSGADGYVSEKKKSKAPAIITTLLLIAAIVATFAYLIPGLFRETETGVCEHIAVKIDAIPATCTEDGLTSGQYCSLCNTVLVKQQTIPAAHKLGPAANCTTAQNCTVCGAEMQAALGHTPGEYEIIKEATKTDGGLKVSSCSVCGEQLSEEIIPAIGNIDLEFRSNGDGTCYVVGIGTCTDTDVVIPSVYNGERVTGIGDEAFRFGKLTSVVIPDGVTNIGTAAFSGCNSLLSIAIPDGVTSIGSTAFGNCYGLVSIHLPEGLTLISDSMFLYCSSLISIEIPEGVTSIGEFAFQGCEELTDIVIPNSVLSISKTAFFKCNNLETISVEENNLKYCDIDGVLFNKKGTELICYPAGKDDTSYVIPDSVSSIGSNAFLYNNFLLHIEIPNGLTRIGDDAFGYCSNLTSIAIPYSVREIGTHAFSYCSSLTMILVENNNLSYCDMDGVLFNKAGTELICYPAAKTGTSYTIPDNVTQITSRAFEDCSSLTSIAIPESVTSIGTYAFSGCSGLTSITIPEGVKSIRDSVFRACSALTSITIPEGVTSIDYYAFTGCSALTSITIPESVTSIGFYAFSACPNLKAIHYSGTTAQWSEITLDDSWNRSTGNYTIQCTDGSIAKDIVVTLN